MSREEAIRIIKLVLAVSADFEIIVQGEKLTEEKCKEAVDIVTKALKQEPCDDVCEWFEQYVDIATDIVELRFSDGKVKRAKRGLYMRDIEKSIRKMLIDQIANEKKQEPKWIPVSERLPEDKQKVIFTNKKNEIGLGIYHKRIGFLSDGITAWMPLPEPYKSESEGEE